MGEIQTDFLNDLRTATAEAHKNVERLPISAIMVSDTIEISEYANYLNQMYTIISSTEDTIFRIVADAIPDIESRRKLAMIEKDLNFINAPIQKKESIFDDTYSVAFALGILYVVEGSSLGGRFLMKNINAVLADRATTNYFAGYGKHTGSSWKQFLDYLNDYVDRKDCAEETISGAIYGFKAIHAQLNEAQ